jgi:hypothetical protein
MIDANTRQIRPDDIGSYDTGTLKFFLKWSYFFLLFLSSISNSEIDLKKIRPILHGKEDGMRRKMKNTDQEQCWGKNMS